jgi:hypothetical protein
MALAMVGLLAPEETPLVFNNAFNARIFPSPADKNI